MGQSHNLRLDGDPKTLVRIEGVFPFTPLDVVAPTLDGPMLEFPPECEARAQLLAFDVTNAKIARAQIIALEVKAEPKSKVWRRCRVERLKLEEFLLQAHRDLVELSKGVRLNHAPRHFWLTTLLDDLIAAGLIPAEECSEPTTVD